MTCHIGDFHQFCSIFQKMHFSRKFIIFELLSFNQATYSILNTFWFNCYRSCLKCILWGGEGGGGQKGAKSSPYEKYPLVKLKLPKQVKRFGAHWGLGLTVLYCCCCTEVALQQQCCCPTAARLLHCSINAAAIAKIKKCQRSQYFTLFFMFSVENKK